MDCTTHPGTDHDSYDNRTRAQKETASETCAYPNDTDGEHDHDACVDALLEGHEDRIALETIDRLVRAIDTSLHSGKDVGALLRAIHDEVQVRMATGVKNLAVSDAIASAARARVARVLTDVEAARG